MHQNCLRDAVLTQDHNIIFFFQKQKQKKNEINYLRITTTHSPNMQPYYLNKDIKLARKSSFKLMKAGVTLNVTGSPHLFQLQLP